MATSNYIADVINGVVTITKSPVDGAVVVVGADSNNTAGTIIGALSIAESLASTAYKSTIPGASLLSASIINNIDEARIDLANPNINNRIDDSTMIALTTDLLSVMSLAAALALAPGLAATAAVAATALSLAALATDNSTDISDTYINLLDKTKDMVNDFDLSGAIDDIFNGTPTTAPLPGLDDFDYVDPNNPDNPNPNDGYPLNPPNPDDGIPPLDPTPPVPRHDPLVLDTNKDGFISTISLEDSNTYFDITGDGIKEKVSWIAASDGLLTYDKNENGKIDGIDEVFGNLTTSGFDELKQLIDSNHDGKIDRKDELYSRLKVWNDNNSDGISQSEELISLKEAGITSIDLNALSTNIELGGATLSEASKYTDTEGNKELAADVKLDVNPTLTTIDTSTIPDYSVDLDTLTLPNLRGYGFFLNSFISYNTNEALKNKAQELISNGVESMSSGFEEYIDIWSGYDEYVNGVKEKLNISGDIQLGDLDKKVWIIEKLLGKDINTSRIEANFENQMQNYKNSTVESAEASNVTIDFQRDYYNNYFQKEILDRFEGAFALQAFYKFDGAYYDVNRAKFVVDDLAAFNTSVGEYLNSTDNSLEDKVYLSKVLNMQEGRFLGIVSSLNLTNEIFICKLHIEQIQNKRAA